MSQTNNYTPHDDEEAAIWEALETNDDEALIEILFPETGEEAAQ